MITAKQVSEAVARFAVLTHFPGEAIARAELAGMFLRMVREPKQLEWLIHTFVDHIGAWHGPREVRAVFCTRFRPLDDIEEWSSIPGFTAADSEREVIERGSAFKHLEAPEDIKRLAELKRIPDV